MSNKRKCLFIAGDGDAPTIVNGGLIDALKAAGWEVITRLPKSKRATREIITYHNIELIFTQNNYGVRVLPVNEINKRKIGVVCHAFCWNDNNDSFEIFSELIDPADIPVLEKIDNLVMWSQHQPEANDRWFPNWTKNGFNFIFLPHCANIIRLFPSAFEIQRDLIFIGNASHKPIAIRDWILPLIKKRNLNTVIFGGQWEHFGINARHIAPHYDNFNRLYPTTAICLNIHSTPQRDMNVLFNDRNFMLPLCGGFLINDSQLSKIYFGDILPIAKTPKEYKEMHMHYLKYPNERREIVIKSATCVAKRHTYFDRMRTVFEALKWNEESEKQNTLAKQFCSIYLDNLESVQDQLHNE